MNRPVNSTPRYAIFFAPADESPLGNFGATVLRRKAQNPAEWVNPAIAVNFENTAVWRACVAKPAHYGFHATINAPFELQPQYTRDQLTASLAEFCQKQQPIPLTNLTPRRTQRFEALAFVNQPAELVNFAADCVVEFDYFRAPLNKDDMDRRALKAQTLSQITHLQEYGYPYVFDDFNFHMTLSGTMPEDENGYLQWLTVLYGQMVPDTPALDRLCLFMQTDRTSPFHRVTEFVFGQKVSQRTFIDKKTA